MAATWTLIAMLGTSQLAIVALLFHMNSSLGNRIDGMGTSLGARIDGQGASLGARIDALNASLSARIDALSEAFVRHTHDV